jgi:hypothetical protein
MAELIVRSILGIERARKREMLDEVEPETVTVTEEPHNELEVFEPEIITEPEPEPTPVLVAAKKPEQLEGRAPRASLEPATKIAEWISPVVLPGVKESVTVEEAEEDGYEDEQVSEELQ